MIKYVVKTPTLLQKLSPSLIWTGDKDVKRVYLTFDDGPTPELTPFILQTLKEHKVKATFFLIGKHAENHIELLQYILNEGHDVGNHTFSHLSGWEHNTKEYISDINKASSIIRSNFFRPPYGRIKPGQIKALSSNYKIVMWDIMSGDFDKAVSPKLCMANIMNNLESGSIILMHDNAKAASNIRAILNLLITDIKNLGYTFDTIKNINH